MAICMSKSQKWEGWVGLKLIQGIELKKTDLPGKNSTVIPMHSRWATVYVSAVQFEYSQFHLPDMVVLGFLKVLSFKTGFHVTHVSFLPCQDQREARNNLFSSWRGGAWFLNVFCEDLPSGLERGTALWCIEYMLVRFERVRMGSKNSWKNNNGIQTHHVFFLASSVWTTAIQMHPITTIPRVTQQDTRRPGRASLLRPVDAWASQIGRNRANDLQRPSPSSGPSQHKKHVIRRSHPIGFRLLIHSHSPFFCGPQLKDRGAKSQSQVH